MGHSAGGEQLLLRPVGLGRAEETEEGQCVKTEERKKTMELISNANKEPETWA